jgi:hypothetical protein
MLCALVVVTVAVAVALLQIRSACPPLAAESAYEVPPQDGSDIASASKPEPSVARPSETKPAIAASATISNSVKRRSTRGTPSSDY